MTAREGHSIRPGSGEAAGNHSLTEGVHTYIYMADSSGNASVPGEPAGGAPDGPARAGQGSFVDRMGAALAAPRRALVVADASGASGRPGSDIALLLGLLFVAIHTRELVVGVWVGAAESVRVGVTAVLGSLSRAISMELAFLFITAVVLTVAAGRRRALGRDFDLACVALVPLLVVELLATLVVRAAGLPLSPGLQAAVAALGYGWSAYLLYLALRQARSRTDRAPGPDLSPGRASRRARIAGLGILVAAALLLGINAAWIGRNIDVLRPISPGNIAPAFALPAVDAAGRLSSETVTLDSLRGKVVVLDFWATWCGPCRESLPAIDRVYRRYRDQGLAMVSINTDDPTKARSMLRSLGIIVPLYMDDGAVAERYRVTTIPHLVIIDRMGMVRHVHRGFEGGSTLDAQVSSLLRAPR